MGYFEGDPIERRFLKELNFIDWVFVGFAEADGEVKSQDEC